MSRRSQSSSAYGGAYGNLSTAVEDDGIDDHAQSEIRRVRLENKELRKLLQEMKQLLQEASDSEQQWVTKQKTFDEIVAAKDKQIEELSAQLGTIEEQIAKGELAPPPPVPKTRTELEEWSDELEKENAKLQQDKKKLEEERKQLREDEESLETQMREMEVSMARERALLARQETELRRLNTEIQHELELMQRGDASLREQMAKFQRRAQDVMVKPQNNGRR
jgi:chromosome segregation ATPase